MYDVIVCCFMQDEDKSGFTFILHKTIMDADFNFVITRSLVIGFIKHILNDIEIFFLCILYFIIKKLFKTRLYSFCYMIFISNYFILNI